MGGAGGSWLWAKTLAAPSMESRDWGRGGGAGSHGCSVTHFLGGSAHSRAAECGSATPHGPGPVPAALHKLSFRPHQVLMRRTAFSTRGLGRTQRLARSPTARTEPSWTRGVEAEFVYSPSCQTWSQRLQRKQTLLDEDGGGCKSIHPTPGQVLFLCKASRAGRSEAVLSITATAGRAAGDC